jgi:hypothetical protein
MGVSGLWVQFANFGGKLCDLFLTLGDAVGTGVLGGSKCSLHAVNAGEHLLFDVIVGLAKHCRLAEHGGAESILGESGVGAFAWSRGAGREYSSLGVLLGTGGAFTGKESLFGGAGGAEQEGAADAEHPKPIEVRGHWDIVSSEGEKGGL